MLDEKDPYIGSAYQQLQLISQDKQKRLEYETREKAIRDHNQLLLEAEQHGEQLGKREEAIRITKDLISLNIPDEVIIKSTHLSAEQLETLKK